VINLPPTVRIFLAAQPADMRRGFDGLAALTTSVIGQDPLSGHLFRFPVPTGDRVEVTPAEIAAILEGIDLSRARRQRRFVLPSATPA
jgi:transposase